MSEYQIFIDESCHLENDRQPIMAMGLIKVDKARSIELKAKFLQLMHLHKTPTELKWNTLSGSRLTLYKALIDLFKQEDGVMFRCVIVKNKANLEHKSFNNNDHDQFYYKLAYQLLKNEYVLPAADENDTRHKYQVFFDIKDTRGKERLKVLQSVLGNKFSGLSPFESFQHLHSHDNFWIQLSDFMLGAVAYKARGLHLDTSSSLAKKEILLYLEHAVGYNICDGTPPWEPKFNIFDFQIRSTKV